MLRQLTKQFTKTLEITNRSICTTLKLCQNIEEPVETKPEDNSVVLDKDKNITLIGINRPAQRNAINSATARKISEAFNKFEEDETSPVAVLYGVGGSFCSGYDILDLGTDQVSVDILMSYEGSVGPTRRHIKKPVICSINGYCIANGLELALMCDLRVMEESAVLGFFNRRFGVPMLDGGTVRLPAMVGFSRAIDLILTGRQVCADEAHRMGIVNRLVPTGCSLTKSIELAKTLASFPQSALLHDRNSLYSAVFDATNFNQAIQNEVMYTSKDIIDQMQQGITWFNKTFTEDTSHSWLKQHKSMADWDDAEVVEAAAEIELQKKEKKEAEIKKAQEEAELKEKQTAEAKEGKKQQAEQAKEKKEPKK